MGALHMRLHIALLGKILAARRTFKLPRLEMDVLHMLFQIPTLRECLAAHFAHEGLDLSVYR